MDNKSQDWTEDSYKNYVFSIASDFVDRILEIMDKQGISKIAMARRLNVSQATISQIIKNPGNLTLKRIVSYARALGMKVTLVTYYDGDPENLHGPILPDVFLECWQQFGKPKNMFEFNTKIPIDYAVVPDDDSAETWTGNIQLLDGDPIHIENPASNNDIRRIEHA